MQHEICLIGLNHRTADVEVRELFAVKEAGTLEKRLLTAPGVREALVVSTCNRVEVLAVGRAGADLAGLAASAWAGHCGRAPGELTPHLYVHAGLTAVHHLFYVASSLDSMVLGEPQILGQLKQAYRAAVENGSTRVIVNRMLHKAFSVAKRVRTETGIGASAVSISYAAVELAKRIFGDMRSKTAMLVGAGEMAELAAAHLQNAGVERILVANRTYERAVELAKRFSGRAVSFAELITRLAETDIVISSTGSPTAIIRARDVKEVLRKRRNRPMFFIDIAVPRDIDPDINSLDNVYLYDIDDLQEIVEENLAQRQEEAAKAVEIVDLETGKFGHWLTSLDLQPTIVDLLSFGEGVAKRELKKTLRRLGPDVSPETEQALETLVLSIGRKLYHEPLVFLKRRAREERSADKFIDLARRMFNLDKETVPGDAHLDRTGDGEPDELPRDAREDCLDDAGMTEDGRD
ncbi:MAG: glutamyl-tRNA reductase [Desulfovibrionaceae bacterium]|nr:glutamyl-tRNA reductase [Desulfovibrionaceae bacterium]MBF0513923.1 glutamyl-tRNA reductase [Desulfovibrionaceae bacterium]